MWEGRGGHWLLLNSEVFQNAWEGHGVFAVHVHWGLCSRSLARACCALQASFPPPSASWSPLIILSTCRFCAWSHFRELKAKFRSWEVNYFPCLFACVCNLLRGRGRRVLTIYIFPHSSPEWLWKLFLDWFSEVALNSRDCCKYVDYQETPSGRILLLKSYFSSMNRKRTCPYLSGEIFTAAARQAKYLYCSGLYFKLFIQRPPEVSFYLLKV